MRKQLSRKIDGDQAGCRSELPPNDTAVDASICRALPARRHCENSRNAELLGHGWPGILARHLRRARSIAAPACQARARRPYAQLTGAQRKLIAARAEYEAAITRDLAAMSGA